MTLQRSLPPAITQNNVRPFLFLLKIATMGGILKNTSTTNSPPSTDVVTGDADRPSAKVGFGVEEETTERSTGSASDEGGNGMDKKSDKRPKMHARFGSVRVAWHRMTVGSAHPGGTEGVPVTLGELDKKERYSTVDNFSQTFHYDSNHEHIEKKKLERLTTSFRRNIALEDHTENEVEEIEKEVTEVVTERKEASREAQIQAFLEYKKKQAAEMERKKKEERKNRKSSGLFSCFGR